MELIEESFPDLHYPLCGLLIGVGCFLVLFIEHVIGRCQTSDKSADGENVSETTAKQANSSDDTQKETFAYTNGNFSPPNYETVVDNKNKRTETTEFSGQSTKNELSKNGLSADSATIATETPNTSSLEVDEHSEFENKQSNLSAKLRTLILTIALSIHMLFEGISVGLTQTDAKIWTLIGALSLHKIVIAFSLGIKLREHSTVKRVLLHLLLFSCMPPIGAAIGIGVSSVEEGPRDMASGILQSLASGVFIYITFFEILHKELIGKYSVFRVFLCVVGYGAIAALTILHTEE